MADGYISQIKTPDNKTYLLRDSEKTDEKVKQTSNSESKEFPIILKNTNNTTNETAGVKYAGGVTVNPSTGKITATNIQADSRLIASKAISQIITGTGTAGSYTNSTYYPAKWTFNTGLTAMDGDIFTIKIPVAGHDYGVFMSIDNGANYYPVVLNGTGRITTHYPVNTYLTVIFEPTGSAASMYAVAGQTSSTRITVTGGVWRVLNYYDSNSNDTGYYHRRIYPNLKAGGAIHPYSIIMQLPNGKWSGITTTAPNNPGKSNVSPVATGKAANTSGFMLGHVLLMYANTTYADTNNIGTYNIWSAHTGLIDARYSFNLANSTGNGFIAYTPVYIVGIVSNGLFYLDTTKWWTQTLPSSEDGKVYIYIGDAYDWYRLTFTEDKPIYWYKDGAIKLYSGASEYALSAPLSGISGADDLKAIEAISGTTGLLKKTAANTWTLDTNNYVTSSGITSVTIGATSPVQSSTSTTQSGSSASTTISLIDAYGDTKNPYGSKTKNYVLAAPSNANGAPSFRALVTADIPNLSWNKITSDKPTTLSGYGITNAVQYNGIDNDIGSSATAANAKSYWANNNKVPKGKVVFNYNSSGTEFTTLFSNNNNSYGSILRWGYQDTYIRILRAHPNQTTYSGWYTEDWEKISAGYADSAGTATSAGKWTTARNISISDSDGTNTGTAVSVDGSAAVTLKLPATIKADITGDAATVNGLTVQTAVPANAVFTDTNKYHKTGSWSGLTYTATAVNSADELKFTIPNKIQTNWELNATSGNSPALLFTRDSSLTDWKIFVASGKLSFQSATDGSTWTERAYFKDNSGDFVATSFTGNGSALTNLNASNISSGTLNLARLGNQNANYVLAGPTSGNAATPTFRALVAADIPNLSWNKITSDKPTTISGYGITDAKIASGVITLGSNTITPVTSVNGHSGSSVSVTASDLGLASALKYVGTKSSLPTATDSTTYSTYNNGDVITVSAKEYAYIKGSNAAGSSWVELGDEGSYKLKQTAFTNSTGTADGTNTSTAFIYSFSQDENGAISNIKTRQLPTLTNVSYTAATDDNEYPILMKYSTGSDTTAAGVKFANTTNKMTTINPSTGMITAPSLTIASNAAIAHLAFARAGWNYITMPNNNSSVISIGYGTPADNTTQRLVIYKTGTVRPGANGSQNLGDDTHKWNNVYGINFYGSTFSGTANKANYLRCFGLEANDDLNLIDSHADEGIFQNCWVGGGEAGSIQNRPDSYGVASFGMLAFKIATNWTGQILLSTNSAPGLYWRANNNSSSPAYGAWARVWDSSNHRVFYGTCAEAAGTAAKTVGCANYDGMKVGDIITVKFDNTNTAASPTLNVNGKGSKSIKMAYSGGTADLSSYTQLAGIRTFIYDGTNWILQEGECVKQGVTDTTSDIWRPVMLGAYNSTDVRQAPEQRYAMIHAARNVKYHQTTGTLRAPVLKTPKLSIEYSFEDKAHIQWNDTDSSIDFIFD